MEAVFKTGLYRLRSIDVTAATVLGRPSAEPVCIFLDVSQEHQFEQKVPWLIGKPLMQIKGCNVGDSDNESLESNSYSLRRAQISTIAVGWLCGILE